MKTCSKCKTRKISSDFSLCTSGKSVRRSMCKECVLAYNSRLVAEGYWKNYYQSHKENMKRNITKARHAASNQVLEYLNKHPCVDCGTNDILVLQFDHVRGKKKSSISALVIQGYTWTSLLLEIAKCDVRCGNCHLRKTAREQNTQRWQFYRRLLEHKTT